MIPGPAPVTTIHPRSASVAAISLACSYTGSCVAVRAEPNTVTFCTSRYGANTANASRISVIAAAAIFRSSGSGWSLSRPSAATSSSTATRRSPGGPSSSTSCRALATTSPSVAARRSRSPSVAELGGLRRERLQQLVEALLEAGHALALELLGDVGHVDADVGQALPRRLGGVDAGIDAPFERAVVGERLDRRVGQRVDRVRSDQLVDVQRVRVGRVLRRRARPQRSLDPRPSSRQRLPPWTAEGPLELAVRELGLGDGRRAPQVERPLACRSPPAAGRPRCRPGRRRSWRRWRPSTDRRRPMRRTSRVRRGRRP